MTKVAPMTPEGISFDTLVTTNLGIIEAEHMVTIPVVGVELDPRDEYKVKTLENGWVPIRKIIVTEEVDVVTLDLEDGSVITKQVNPKVGYMDETITLHNEGEIDYPALTMVLGLHQLDVSNHRLTLMKLFGMLTAYGKINSITGVIGMVNVPPVMMVDFGNLMSEVFKLVGVEEEITTTKQTASECSSHYVNVGIARVFDMLIRGSVPFETLCASNEEMLMFLSGMYNPRFRKIASNVSGGRYVANVKKLDIARRIYSLVRHLGYAGRLITEPNGTFSVMTVGVNIHEDSESRRDMVRSRESRELTIINKTYSKQSTMTLVLENSEIYLASGYEVGCINCNSGEN